ncbi:type 1 glutamine amidotransferase domain-containing protein [Thalassomonas sp. RHCl1]|uniref:type 1 glutamine amidotransferase domain-containing protein n=1 Tax=Thalassomonas sp. RHCl1 TaxID=2995320 RepID=UPI00248BA63D|nr:type 1 glutamine amidotransferase domain-containing protein [Thalassomonas sp. RHCl1]
MNIKSIAYRLMQVLYLVPLLLLSGAGNTAVAEEANFVIGKGKGKVLVIVSSDRHGFWLPEVLEPYQLLAQAGYQIDVASPEGGQGKASGEFRLSNKQKQWFEQSKLKLQLKHSMPLAEINPQSYVAVYFAGGAGPMFDLPDNVLAQQITRDIYEAGGIVAADCHGPAALINVILSNGKRLISGKKITAKANIEEGRWARNNYPFLLEDKIKELGGHYLASGKNQQHVVVDGRLITGQNPASAIPMAESLIEQLSSQGF